MSSSSASSSRRRTGARALIFYLFVLVVPPALDAQGPGRGVAGREALLERLVDLGVEIREARLHRPLGLQARKIPAHGGDGEGPARTLVGHGGVAGVETTVDLDRVPALRVAHVVHGQVVVLAPEKGHCVE